MPVVLSNEVLSDLEAAVASRNYTKFYEILYKNGSAIAALYIPGPTGQGLFGNLSHNVVSDYIERMEFERRRPEISQTIAEGLLEKLRATRTDDGEIRLLTDAEFLEEEIRLFELLPNIPVDAYPGHDLINLFGLDIPGSTEGRTLIQSAMNALQASIEAGEGYPELNGEIITREELIARGGSFVIEENSLIVGYLDPDGNEIPTRYDVFFYVDQFYSTDTLTLIDGIYYDTTGSQPLPLGVTFGTVWENLDTILQRAVDLRGLDHAVDVFLEDDVIESLSHIYGTNFEDTFIVSSVSVVRDFGTDCCLN